MRKTMLDTALDVGLQYRLALGGIPGQRRIQKIAVFPCGRRPAKGEGAHLISQILVEDDAMNRQQLARSAAKNEGLMEFPVKLLPTFLDGFVTLLHAAFHAGQLVMRSDDPSLPIHVARLK